MSTTRAASAPRAWAAYGRSWRRTPRSVLYLLVVFVLAMVSLSVLAPLFATGVGLLILVIGLPIIVGTLFIARGFGVADRFLLRLTGLPDIEEPLWKRELDPPRGFWASLIRPLRCGHYWTYLLHGMIVSPVLSIVSFAVTVSWVAVGLGGLTFAVWGAFIPRGTQDVEWGQYVSAALPWLFAGQSSWTVEVTLYAIAGVVFTVTLPWVVGGLARLHHLVATGLLGRWPSDDLAAEARAESAARSAAVQAESAGLRRLERDIHDGPQQRLVRLQLDLAALERRAIAGDTDAAASLAREAQLHTKAALDELRALSSGMAPPLLQDRGLSAALTAVAANCAIPVTLAIDPAIDANVSDEVARTIYFVVAELLTNTVKHAGASSAALEVALRRDATPTVLSVSVSDNGRGGASFTAGHGLEGLRGRVAGLRGSFVLDSPAGGPTTIGVHVPLVSGAAP